MIQNVQKEAVKSEDILDKFASTSSVLHVLDYILPNVNELLEDNILLIGQSFSKIAETSVAMQKNLAEKKYDEIQDQIFEISKNVSSAIVGLQFQDRVSQNLAICLMISSMINKHIVKVISEQKGDVTADIDISKEIYDKIFLGEIRNEFVKFLVDYNFIKHPSDIGHNPISEVTTNSEDIELF
ncbi:MAG TPA: hypothetical protein DIV86_07515 [Alphaproteobacteria bacterium]|nr:hypothetical protein [Alphaproteobacteria bacterium]